MAKANVALLNSILWNLREVTNLAEKIKNHCGDVDCISWRYPLTSCSDLEVFKLLQSNRNLDSYTYILELTYDRLLYIFNLIIKYLETADSLRKFRPGKNVVRPRTLSLASVLHMLWDRIKAHMESVNKMDSEKAEKTEKSDITEQEIDVKMSKSTICTQSDVCSISICSCCEMVQEFVTQLVLETEKILEKLEIESAISNERKIMREYLVEMTNWSAMTRWLGAISKDFAAIYEKADQATTTSRKLRNRLDSGEKKMKSKLEQYEDENQKLYAKLRESEAKTQKLKAEVEELMKDKLRMGEEIKMKNSQIVIASDLENQMTAMKKRYETKLSKKKEKELKKEVEKENEWNSKLESEKSRCQNLEKQNERLEETVKKLEEDIENLKLKVEEMNLLEVRCKSIETEAEALKQENVHLSFVLKEKQKSIEEYSARLLHQFPQLNGVCKNKYKASGNPLVDMENQIEANRLRVNQINAENEKLEKTLEKLKAIKG